MLTHFSYALSVQHRLHLLLSQGYEEGFVATESSEILNRLAALYIETRLKFYSDELDTGAGILSGSIEITFVSKSYYQRLLKASYLIPFW